MLHDTHTWGKFCPPLESPKVPSVSWQAVRSEGNLQRKRRALCWVLAVQSRVLPTEKKVFIGLEFKATADKKLQLTFDRNEGK